MSALSSLKRKVLNQGALWISLFKLRPLLRNINSDSIVIDCGANVGDITAQFAKTGATVYSFEPDPTAFTILKRRFEHSPNVHLFNQAVWVENTKLSLFFHADRQGGQKEFTVSSSVYDNKVNVDASNKTETQAIDLAEFIHQLGKKVSLIKIDVEGAEIDILKDFIKKETYKKFDLAVVETHETKIPGHVEEVKNLERVFAEKDIRNIKLNWI